MIRRFDELLADKTNKMSLTELEKRVFDTFLQKKEMMLLQQKTKEINQQVKVQMQKNEELFAN